MSLKVGGVDPAKIMVGGTPAKKVMVGTGTTAVQVWSAIRKVTINSSGSSFVPGSQTGDITLVKSFTPSIYGQYVRFTAATTCDKSVWNDDIHADVSPGETIPADTPVLANLNGFHLFTEVI